MRWREKVAFSQSVRRHMGECAPFWRYPLFYGGGITAVLGLAALVGFGLQGQLSDGCPLFMLVAAGYGIFIGVASYVATRWTPVPIRLNDKGIARERYQGTTAMREWWLWSDIAYCRIVRAEDGGQEFDVLAVFSHAGDCVPLEFGGSVRVDQLQQWFAARQRALHHDATVELKSLSQLLARPFVPSNVQMICAG
jgi:hypothetical protein